MTAISRSTRARSSPELAAMPVPARASDLLRVMSVGGFVFSESRHQAPIPRHMHEHTTLTMLREGVFEEHYPGGASRVCQASSLLIRPAGEVHADQFGRDGALNFVLEIASERFADLGAATTLLTTLSHHRTRALDRIAARMQLEFALRDPASTLALESLALELMAHLVRNAGPRDHTHAAPPWLLRARDVLHAHVADQSIRIGRLAEEANVHPVHFARAFRAHFGCTPGAFMRQLRLDAAAHALTHSDRPLTEVALAAGFSDQSHLARAFRAAFGRTPGQWRHLHRSTYRSS